MAKRGRKSNDLASYAEAVGAFLGQVRSGWDQLPKERDHLAKQLRGVIDDAQAMLSEIGEGVQRGARQRPATAATKTRRRGRPKGRKMSAAGAKIAGALRKAAQKAWAKKK